MKRSAFTLLIVAAGTVLGAAGSHAQGIISTAVGTTAGYGGDGGPATAAKIFNPTGIAFDGASNLYIADRGNSAVRKVDASGTITTFAGTPGSHGYSGDGGPATAALFSTGVNIAVDPAGNVYIADHINRRIRKVNTSGIVNTIIGNGTMSVSGDGGPASAATVSAVSGMTVDAAGNLYFADLYCIRRIDPSGIVTKYVGTGVMGSTGDGGMATATLIDNPGAVAIDAGGNLYFAENATSRIRKVNPAGFISTVAGNGTTAYSGDGGPATAASLYNPNAIAFDLIGNIYVAGDGDGRVRRISPSGFITTYAGTNIPGPNGDGGPATAATLQYPRGLAFDSYYNLYISEYGPDVIRKISNYTTGLQHTTSATGLTIYPNPAGSMVYIGTSAAAGKIHVLDISGKLISEKTVTSTLTSLDIHSIPRGIYFAVWQDGTGAKATQKFIVE